MGSATAGQGLQSEGPADRYVLLPADSTRAARPSLPQKAGRHRALQITPELWCCWPLEVSEFPQDFPTNSHTGTEAQGQGRPPWLMQPHLLHRPGVIVSLCHLAVPTLCEAHRPIYLPTGQSPTTAKPFLSLRPARYTRPPLSTRSLFCSSSINERSSKPE